MAVETAEVDIENLQLDPGNPRLAAGVDQSQQAMMEFLTDVIQVQDLIDSILASGFVAADPIIARKEGERYFVIEGNRRLCALRWLVEPSKWTARTPPKLFRQPSEDEKATLRKVKVQLGWNQEDLTAYLAYKHVTSTKEWSPEAKARFVKKHANGDFSDENLRLFAQKTGSKLASLKRWLCALFAVEQAIEANIITEAHANEINFGTFYTYLGGAAVKNFLGIDDDNLRPHSVRNVEHLEEFFALDIRQRRDCASPYESRSKRP